MSDSAEVMYKCAREDSAADGRGVIWNDPESNVMWPLKNPLLPEKDKMQPLFRDTHNNIVFNGDRQVR
jgi:dTDP-4-dehydrorhamnose 3,5-epimerase